MFQYNNQGYHGSQPASTEHIPYRRRDPDNNRSTVNTDDKTVGIGYYGVRKTTQSADSGIRSPTSNDFSVGSPTGRLHSTFNDGRTEDSYHNHMNANMDLSPRDARSPVRPVSEGSVFDSFGKNRLSPQSRVKTEFDRSTESTTDRSDANHSGSSFHQQHTLSQSAPTFDTAKPSVISLREKWETNKVKSTEDESRPPYSVIRNNNNNRYGSPYTTPQLRNPTVHSAQSTMERDYSTGSLKRDPVTHRKLPNGVVRREGSLTASKRSLNWSHLSLKSGSRSVTAHYGKGYGVHNSLVNMGLAALLALVMAILAVQLLFRVSGPSTPGLSSQDSVLRTNASYFGVAEVVVALACIAAMLDLCCLLTCSLQGYFAAKLIKCSQGEERAFRYLKECMPTRFIAILGFFLSIPVYFFALMLYVILEYRSTPAIVAVVVLTIGVSFVISTVVHSTYMWRVEKQETETVTTAPNTPANHRKTRVVNGELTNQNELSTLV